MPPRRRNDGQHSSHSSVVAGGDQIAVEFLRHANNEVLPEGSLVISPINKGDEDAIEQIGFFWDPKILGYKSVAYMVGGIPGTPDYRVINLNSLPRGVEVELTITTRGIRHTTRWEGEKGVVSMDAEREPEAIVAVAGEEIPSGSEPTDPEPPEPKPVLDGPDTSDLKF